MTILSTYANEIKRILIVIVPGGKSHHFILKELLSYAQSKVDNYEFHILVHNIDKNIWLGTNYTIYDYGDSKEYTIILEKALESVKKYPIFGYIDFHNALLHSYQSFIDAKILEKLSKFKFDLLIPDFPNYIANVLKKELKIPNTIFFNPTCSPSIVYGDLEINTAYVPFIGSKFTDEMSFIERLQNFVDHYGSKVFFRYYMYLQKEFWKKNNILVSNDIFIHDSVYLFQCTNGVHFPIPLPPNFDNIGPILPKPAKPIVIDAINNFLDKFDKNIYFSQGTIVKIINFNKILDIFNTFKDVGFILSFKKEYIENHTFPDNVLALEWVPQNDLLGHKKIHGFISHGGINSVLESIYHAKPLICIGISIDQINNAVIVDYRKIGIKFTRERDVTAKNLKSAIYELLNNEEFKINVVKLSKIIRHENPKDKFFQWINYTLHHGYKNLIVRSYVDKNYIELNNIDVILFFIVMLLLVLFILRFIFWLICCKKNIIKNNKKKDL